MEFLWVEGSGLLPCPEFSPHPSFLGPVWHTVWHTCNVGIGQTTRMTTSLSCAWGLFFFFPLVLVGSNLPALIPQTVQPFYSCGPQLLDTLCSCSSGFWVYRSSTFKVLTSLGLISCAIVVPASAWQTSAACMMWEAGTCRWHFHQIGAFFTGTQS